MASVFTTRLAAFATGTGTAETAAQNVTVPADSRELISLQMWVTALAPAPAESVMGIGKLKGDNWVNPPYEIAAEIGSAHLGAIGGPWFAQPRKWPANLPVSPNSTIQFTYEPIDALADNGQVSVKFKWSNVRTGAQGVKRVFSREVPTSTTTDSSVTLRDCLSITKLYFGVGASTVAADDPGDYSITIEMTGISEHPTSQMNTQLSGIEATSGLEISYLEEETVDLTLLPDVSQITPVVTLTETSALGTAGQWFYGFEYIPRSVQVPG